MRKSILSLVMLTWVGAATAATPKQVVLNVENMTCPACSITIEKALDQVPGVTGKQVNTQAATVVVTFDAERTSLPVVTRAITDAGFPASLRAKGD
ncbi:heavy-metal-associated domain-containing protein [Noviluteimonas gilva]|uniref:Heavy metal transporter n=1 Tax=Noviluteimonas gilva TaxID=2682097 RepID=A0A7C9HU47_9GAMM|nr:cation transporter [Lysobacter gilvus]MUV13378.1 heavy metal transporter [Lysobacter gilvus]